MARQASRWSWRPDPPCSARLFLECVCRRTLARPAEEPLALLARPICALLELSAAAPDSCGRRASMRSGALGCLGEELGTTNPPRGQLAVVSPAGGRAARTANELRFCPAPGCAMWLNANSPWLGAGQRWGSVPGQMKPVGSAPAALEAGPVSRQAGAVALDSDGFLSLSLDYRQTARQPWEMHRRWIQPGG